jgi:hypothetical protein
MITLRVDGIPELQAELKDKINPKKISHSLYMGVLDMEAEAKRRCPVGLTRQLLASITHYPPNEGSLIYEIMATAPYADCIEYGTMYIYSGTPEDPYIYTSTIGKYPSYRPFLRSAVYDKFNTVVNMIEQSLNEGE